MMELLRLDVRFAIILVVIVLVTLQIVQHVLIPIGLQLLTVYVTTDGIMSEQTLFVQNVNILVKIVLEVVQKTV
jgi:hypothetical protein